MIKVSDYIFDYFLSKGIDTIFCVAGGAAAHLLNSVKEKNIKIIHCYHEQACAMAAEGYTRISGKPAIVLVTNGPGSTNTITGILGAYQDSIPMIVISGQVPKNQTIEHTNLRQLGVQECDIISIVKSITKYAKQIRTIDNKWLSYTLSEAYTLAVNGRKGPVWLDIPLDIQSEMINEDELMEYEEDNEYEDTYDIEYLKSLILNAKKPIIIAGNGIHLSQTESQFNNFIQHLNIPIVTTWNAKDLFHYDNDQFAGTFGLLGERAGNFAVQNSDLLLILGSRLSIPCIGYNSSTFSPNSIKIMVDIDKNELEKKTLNIDHKINENLEVFFDKFKDLHRKSSWWNKKVYGWKQNYPIFQESYKDQKDGVNSYYFIEKLGKYLNKNHIIVTDMGTAFTCTMQALKMNGSRLFTSSGTSSMGYGLPAAIGAWVANPTKEIILIAGDGGFQMNIQELQTISHYKIPIKIFILNSDGYLAISIMQDNLFNGNYIGSTPSSGVSAPDFVGLSEIYLGKSKHQYYAENAEQLDHDLPWVMKEKSSCLFEIKIPKNQLMLPRVQSSKDENGKIVSNSLENMYPYLSEDEMKKTML